MKLLLFDIDQTILHSGGAGERALLLALRQRFGPGHDLANVEIPGKTDIWIAHRIFQLHHIHPSPEDINLFLHTYLRFLETELTRSNSRLLPGFPHILHTLAQHPNIAIGLLTGNLRRGAELKLRHHRILHHFPFGAFADDSLDRNNLGPFARDRASQLHRAHFQPRDIYIIGDTPHDIACAKAIGAVSVGVATGHYTRAALQAASADIIFDDLSDIPQVLRTLGLA
ncbi:MAG: HAD hydrolase-like protein [Chthoniobacteraceae bacterium]